MKTYENKIVKREHVFECTGSQRPIFWFYQMCEKHYTQMLTSKTIKKFEMFYLISELVIETGRMLLVIFFFVVVIFQFWSGTNFISILVPRFTFHHQTLILYQWFTLFSDKKWRNFELICSMCLFISALDYQLKPMKIIKLMI